LQNDVGDAKVSSFLYELADEIEKRAREVDSEN
jgi:hypothetical protein